MDKGQLPLVDQILILESALLDLSLVKVAAQDLQVLGMRTEQLDGVPASSEGAIDHAHLQL